MPRMGRVRDQVRLMVACLLLPAAAPRAARAAPVLGTAAWTADRRLDLPGPAWTLLDLAAADALPLPRARARARARRARVRAR
jgi:hypothetical protein